MQIKKYEAKNLKEALHQIKTELGPDALVLSTQENKNGWLGKNSVEVTVAFDPQRKEQEKKLPFLEKRKEAPAEYAPPKPRTVPLERKAIVDTERPGLFSQRFLALGFSHTESSLLSQKILHQYPKKDLLDESFFIQARNRVIFEGVKILDDAFFEEGRGYCLVGNAGSGKSTLAIKLSLALKAKERRVQLSSIDRRKLVGQEEIKRYSQLLSIPYESKFKAVRDHVQIIDTPSLNFTSKERMAELTQFSEQSASMVWVVNCLEQLEIQLEQCEMMKKHFLIDAIVFTRLDYLTKKGSLIEFLSKVKIPLLGASTTQSFKVSFQFLTKQQLLQSLR